MAIRRPIRSMRVHCGTLPPNDGARPLARPKAMTDRAPPRRSWLAAGLGLALLAGTAAAEPPSTASEASDRPRIGLALGGGGARGGAHVGVLKVLEELRVPVDCVAGTSMGALVGATFASGIDAAAVEREIRAIDWAATIGAAGQRALAPMQRKLAAVSYSNDIQFIIHNGRLRGTGGLLASQHVEERLRLLVGKARDAADFDQLPIPFRAVATDIRAGRMVVLDAGDLTRAMRASMAVPGVFAPVLLDDMVLADGGMMRNIPVDVARELCADVVIAVALQGPTPPAEELRSALAVAGRSIDAMIHANEAAQLASLTEADVAIVLALEDINSTQFERVVDTIPLGEQAAREMGDSLRRYALPEDEYRRWRDSVRPVEAAPSRIEEIRFKPLRHASPAYLASRMRTQPGDEVPLAKLERDMSRIFASSDFLRVDYRLLPGRDGGEILEIEAFEHPGNADFLRFDLGLTGSTGGDVLFVLRADHRREWLNARGGQWRNALQLGQQSELETAFYQPLDGPQRFYLEPAVRVARSYEDIYDDGDRIARYHLLEGELRFELGWNLSDHTRLRGGLRRGWHDFGLDTGQTTLLDLDRSGDTRLALGAIIDTRNAAALPTRGSFAQLEYTRAGAWLGGQHSYDQVEVVAGHYAPFGGQVLTLTGGIGRTLSGDLPRYRDFRIGGIRSFPALARGEQRGEGYWSGSAVWAFRLRDIQALLGQSFYGGVGLHALRVTDRLDLARDETLFGLSFSLGARTPFGPLLFSLGVTDDGRGQVHLALGRPVSEGSLLDRLH